MSLRSAALAAAWGGYLEAHATKLYAGYGSGDTAHALPKMAETGELRDGQSTVRDLYRTGRSGFGQSQVLEALATLRKRGWMQVQAVRASPQGGRSRAVIRLHPLLKGGKA